jgi:hypothetical protein
MTATAFPRLAVMKEVRALLPTWSACALTLCAAALVRDPRIPALGMAAFSLGSVALGAQSMGHEYTCRTLSLLLVQPSERRKLFLIKFGVLAAMLLTLAAAAWTALFIDGRFQRPSLWHPSLLVLLPTACGLFIAPLLTMVCRSQLAGVVFTGAIPGMTMLLSQLLAAAIGAGRAPDQVALWIMIFSCGMIAVWAIAAVLNWRMFMRLEAIDGTGAELRAPRWVRGSTRAPARSRHPLWVLAKKELHLQQMTFVIVTIYLIFWTALSVMKHVVPELRGFPLFPLTIFYVLMLSLLIGSLPSAEERQFGTLEWQMLLPMAAWQQWSVKAGIVLGLRC